MGGLVYVEFLYGRASGEQVRVAYIENVARSLREVLFFYNNRYQRYRAAWFAHVCC
jgi:hypothetical protein